MTDRPYVEPHHYEPHIVVTGAGRWVRTAEWYHPRHRVDPGVPSDDHQWDYPDYTPTHRARLTLYP